MSIFKIEEARNEKELNQAHRIAYDSLIEMDYTAPNEEKKKSLFPELDESDNTHIIVAKDDEQRVVATHTLTLDGEEGLSTDHDFEEETKVLRKKHNKLACLWRFATSREFRNKPKLILSVLDFMKREIKKNDVDVCLTVIEKKT
jgi:hypothetical protein